MPYNMDRPQMKLTNERREVLGVRDGRITRLRLIHIRRTVAPAVRDGPVAASRECDHFIVPIAAVAERAVNKNDRHALSTFNIMKFHSIADDGLLNHERLVRSLCRGTNSQEDSGNGAQHPGFHL